MTRNLKALGLALMAVFALSAIAASSASATTDVATVDGAATKATVTGLSHDNKFTITNGSSEELASFECTTTSITTTVEESVAGATITATYTGKPGETPHGTACTANPFGSVTVDMNGCDYKMGGGTTNVHGAFTYIPVWIVCPTNQEIVITSNTCETKVPPQTPTQGGIRFTNENEGGTRWDVKADIEVTGITFTAANSFGCFIAGIPTHGQTADYKGTVTLQGYEDTGTHTHNGSRLGITFS